MYKSYLYYYNRLYVLRKRLNIGYEYDHYGIESMVK